MNRSTLFEFLRKDTEMELRYIKIGKGNYPVLRVPFKWEKPLLLINNSKITEFQALILFSTELAIRFGLYGNEQVNIPYRDIEYFEVNEYNGVGTYGLYKDEKYILKSDKAQ